MTGWYSLGPELGCLGTTRLLPCHEATSALTPPSHVHPAFLRIHTQPGCPGTARPGPRPPCPAPTHRPKPLAPVANNLCLSGKQQHETEKASALSAKPRPQLLCRQPRSLPLSCLCASFFVFCFFFLFQIDIENKNKKTKKTTFCSRRFGLTDGKKALGTLENSASSFSR